MPDAGWAETGAGLQMQAERPHVFALDLLQQHAAEERLDVVTNPLRRDPLPLLAALRPDVGRQPALAGVPHGARHGCRRRETCRQHASLVTCLGVVVAERNVALATAAVDADGPTWPT